MRKLDLSLSQQNFNLFWRALHAQERALQAVIAEYGEASDEAADAANDMIYLRLYREEIRQKAEPVFPQNAFVLDDWTL